MAQTTRYVNGQKIITVDRGRAEAHERDVRIRARIAEDHEARKDPITTMAAYLFNVRPSAVTESQRRAVLGALIGGNHVSMPQGHAEGVTITHRDASL